MAKLTEQDLILVSCVVCRIWLQQNSIVFDDSISSPSFLVQSTVDSLESFHLAN
jgi:hypothetical protein